MTDVDKALVLSRHAAEYARRIRLAELTGVSDSLLAGLAREAVQALELSRRAYERLSEAARAEFDKSWPMVFASISS